jgi:sulfocyanin
MNLQIGNASANLWGWWPVAAGRRRPRRREQAEGNHLLKPLAAALLLSATSATAAEEQLVPSWMTVDADARKVTMDVVAGYNPNNSNWNFNGYYDGDMTVVVPQSWRVEITLTNRDGDVPHSLVVMADPGADNLPLQGGREQAAFPRAYSKSPEQGISTGDQDTIAFKTNKAGDFMWFCGVPAHGQSGMWTRFAVTGDAETPYITITAPGRQAAGETSVDDRPATEIRVFIHHVAGHQADAALARQLADYLRRRGFIVADIRPVDFSIGEPSVRYFFARDRTASQDLVKEVSPFFEETPSQAPDEASDFTHYVPKPRPGNVEVWLPAW